jgi:hypothetical protein
MLRKSRARIAIAVTALFFFGGVITVEKLVSLKIVTRVEQQLPSASGISASIPLFELPSDLRSDLIKSVSISSKGLSVNFQGNDIQLENLSSSL